MNRKKVLLCIVLVVIIIGGIALHEHKNKPKQQANKKTTQSQVAITPSGIVYPSSWTSATQESTTDEKAGVISEAAQESSSTTVIVRKVAGELAKDFDINTLPNQVVAGLENGVSGFQLVNQSVVQLQSYNAVRIDYTSKGSGSQAFSNEMYIVPTQNNTFYITYSSGAENISQLQNDITSINTSIATYIKTNAS